MASAEDNNSRVQKLTGENYYDWKFDMSMLLIGKGVWDIVTGDEVLDEGATNKEKLNFKRRENVVLSYVWQLVRV